MAKWYVLDLSFFIPDSKRKTNKFEKNEKTYEKFNKIFKKILPPASPKKNFHPGGETETNNFSILALVAY